MLHTLPYTPELAGLDGPALRNLITLCEAHHEAIHEAQGVTPCATR